MHPPCWMYMMHPPCWMRLGVIVVRSDHQGWEDRQRRKERHKVAAVFAIHMASHGIEGSVHVTIMS